MESMYERVARELAATAHLGQKDKAGRPYISHLRKVAKSPRLVTCEEKAAGWLHDLLEDTDYNIQDLEWRGFSIGIIMMVDTLTRRDGESYTDFIERIGRFEATRRIKLADIDDHLDDTTHISESMVTRYKRAKNYLLMEDDRGY